MKLLRGIAIISLTLLAGGCSTFTHNDQPAQEDPGRRSLGSVIDDQTIETTATANINRAAQALDDANVIVVSYNGNVLLIGQVPNEELRVRAAEVAANVKSVKSVRNELTVGDNASFAVHSSDTLITTKVKSRLLTAANIKDSRVKVITENGVVFLMGLVTHEEADLAGKATQDTGGVQKVVLLFEYVDG
ncbi:MAG: phospholipid-binding protein [Verrucomicrobiaceae bacterium]|nr:phospholipid-binding protein [Verrucomicrobiaceae bacterium]